MSRDDTNASDMTHGVYRRIYGGLTRSRRLNAVSLLAELAFFRLHCVCDDFGTFEADPYLINSQAFPRRAEVTEADAGRAVEELAAAGLVELYEVRGERYGQIARFTEFQRGGRNGKRIRRLPAKPADPTGPPAVTQESDASGESECVQGTPGASGGIQVSPGESGFIQGNPGASGGIPVDPGAPCAHQDQDQNQDHTKNKTNCVPAASASTDPPARGHAGKKSPVPETGLTSSGGNPHATLVTRFCEAWARKNRGQKYPFKGKDAAHLRDVLKAVDGDLARATGVVDAYLASTDPFFVRGGHKLGLLVADLPRFLAARAGTPVATGSPPPLLREDN